MLSMNKNMYAMNTPGYLFKTNINMFVKHLECMSDENLLSTTPSSPYYESKFSSPSSPVDNDDRDEEIIFNDEQFQNILEAKYNSFEKKPFDTDEEWVMILKENDEDNQFYDNHQYDDDDEDGEDGEGEYSTVVSNPIRVEKNAERV